MPNKGLEDQVPWNLALKFGSMWFFGKGVGVTIVTSESCLGTPSISHPSSPLLAPPKCPHVRSALRGLDPVLPGGSHTVLGAKQNMICWWNGSPTNNKHGISAIIVGISTIVWMLEIMVGISAIMVRISAMIVGISAIIVDHDWTQAAKFLRARNRKLRWRGWIPISQGLCPWDLVRVVGPDSMSRKGHQWCLTWGSDRVTYVYIYI